MENRFEPSKIEKEMYKNWESKGYFKCKKDYNKKPFVIVMPPPNVTGKLHMGHALDQTLQDILIRYNRLKGVPTLWIPGTDHAAIATEVKVVEKLKKEGKTKEMLGREGFLKEAWAWKEEFGGEIKSQIRRMGSSCDWEKERFTMDEVCSEAVKEVFLRLYNEGYIYRGKRIVNWCPHCKTPISETEVEYSENNGHLWHIRYYIENEDKYITIATTRPETLLGDTAVAVNPRDERYKDLVGKNVILPIVNKKIPVVADEYVEMEFGTGVVKITPAHDPNDFMVGQRHNLEVINIMNEDATINENGGKFEGLDRYEAREKIVAELEEKGLLEKIEDYTNNVGSCYRCHTVIEPYLSLQWFVKMEKLAKPAIEAVKNGEIKFIPKRFEKTYFNWMESIQDWCISRQIWWGHRIPAYYCDRCDKITVSKENVNTCECGGNLHQDEDSLDTWFSSALWPFSVSGWPNETDDLKYFYPTSTLVTGYDIITFWVSKMIFTSLKFMGEKPFENIYIHGIVRDSLGRKMSKSLGNGINPLDVIDEYGTDALRFSLSQNISAGNDIRYIPEKLDGARNYINKLWNAAKFLNMYLDKVDINGIENVEFMPEDKWIINMLNTVITDVTKNIDKFEIGVALTKLYNYSWSYVCDWYIEMIKPRLYKGEGKSFESAVFTLNYVLKQLMIMLHPYMPFVTEEIYLNISHDKESIMLETYPEIIYNFEDMSVVTDITEAIKSIRNYRAENDIPNSKKVNAFIALKSENYKKIIEDSKEYLLKMAYLENINYIDNSNVNNEYASFNLNAFDIYIDFTAVVDKDEEIAKINSEIAKAKSELERAERMLSNEAFVSKAPAKLIEEEKAKKEKYEQMLSKLQEKLDSIK